MSPKDLIQRGKIWHYDWTHNDQRYRGTTECDRLEDAKVVLDAVKRKVILGQHAPTKAPTLAAVMEAWLFAAVGIHSTKHIRTTEQMIRLYLDPALGHLRLDGITDGLVEALMKAYIAGGRSVAGANLLLRTLNLFMGWAIKRKIIKAKPYHVRPIKAQKRPRPVLSSVEDFFVAMDEFGNIQLGVMARVAIGMGLRESEILGMRWEWLNDGVYTVGQAKNRKTRQIPVPAWVLESIEWLDKGTEWMFPDAEGNPHYPGYFSKAVKKVTGMGAHRIRASFATFHVRAGTPINELKDLMGHADISTTALYLEDALATKKEAQDRLTKALGMEQKF